MLDPHEIFNVRKHTQWQNRGRTNDKKGNAGNPRLRALMIKLRFFNTIKLMNNVNKQTDAGTTKTHIHKKKK